MESKTVAINSSEKPSKNFQGNFQGDSQENTSKETISSGNRGPAWKVWCQNVFGSIYEFSFVTFIFIIAALVIFTLPEVQVAEVPEIESSDIVVYSSIPKDLVGNYLAEFEEKNPDINVTLINETTLALTNRLLAEAKEPQADVIWGLAVTSMLLVEWNYISTFYQPEGLERVTPIFRDDTDPPHWVGISARSLVLCINEDALQDAGLPAPESWADLIQPEYEGLLVMPTPNTTSVGYLLISAILNLHLYDEADGWEYLRRLDQSTGQYVSSVTRVCPTVATGEYPIGISYDYRAVQQRLADDTIKLVYPIEKTSWEVEVNGLVRKEAIKPAAKHFLDWAISDDVMRLYAQDRAIVTVDLDDEVPEGFLQNPNVYLLDLDIPWIAANRMRMQKEWLELFGDPEHR